MNNRLILATIVLAAGALPMQAAHAGDKPFPKIVPALEGAPPEGFAIGGAYTAYNGSVDGSIYKMDLRTGQGETLVEGEPDFDVFSECYKLGMRVDPRSNLLFVAGCIHGDAYVFDADTGEEIMKYQLAPEYTTVINDLAITRDAVYFTDSYQPVLYRLPVSRNGRLPAAGAATTIPLPAEFTLDFETDFCCAGNGIVATPDGKTLIVGHSALSKIYRVDPGSGDAAEIIVDPPLTGFLDGIVFRDGILYILTPYDPDPEDMIQVVALEDDMLSGTLLGVIRDADLDGVASGALHGDSLYVNNARYFDFPGPGTDYWITRLSIYDVE